MKKSREDGVAELAGKGICYPYWGRSGGGGSHTDALSRLYNKKQKLLTSAFLLCGTIDNFDDAYSNHLLDECLHMRYNVAYYYET